MNRVRVCCFLLAATLLFSAGVCVWAAQFTGELLVLCERAEKESSAENFPALQKTISELSEKYDSKTDLLELFVRRDLILAPQSTLQVLSAFAQPDNTADLHAELSRAKYQILELREIFLGFT